MYTCLLYNVNVASSVTSQGRAFISTASMFFEMFLNNNVKFGSLNEAIEYINNIVSEKPIRRFNDKFILDENITVEDCFAKIILSCGYKWVPCEEEMEIIWRIVRNLSQENLNRVFYKNNLFGFVDNTKVFNIVRSILHKLHKPLYNSLDIPEEIANDIRLFSDLLQEYVYYRYMVMDRIDRCANMIKSVIAVSDTDSAIVSIDGWYRYVVNKINGEEFKIANYCDHPIIFHDYDEDGNPVDRFWEQPIKFVPKKLDYDFNTDQIIELEHTNNPDILTPNDNIRYSIMNILAYALDRLVNDYIEKSCENSHSLKITDIVKIPVSKEQLNIASEYGIVFNYDEYGNPNPEIKYKHNRKCRMILKNEFLRKMKKLAKMK